MTTENKAVAFWLLLIFGATMGLTNLFAPVHEFGHYAYATLNGQDAEIIAWGETKVEPNIGQVFAGWNFEFLVFALLAIIVGWAGQYSSGKYFTGSFFLGYALVTWFRAYGSYDFNEYVYILADIENINVLKTQTMMMAIDAKWTLRCSAVSFFMLLLYVRWIYKSTKA